MKRALKFLVVALVVIATLIGVAAILGDSQGLQRTRCLMTPAPSININL